MPPFVVRCMLPYLEKAKCFMRKRAQPAYTAQIPTTVHKQIKA